MLKLWYKETRVLTTQQVADILGTDPKFIQRNFQRNKKRYVEGKHYFLLKGEELKQFKAVLNDEDQVGVKLTPSSLKLIEAPDSAGLEVPKPTVGKRTPTLMLWTRRGLMHHVKSVNTDATWALFDSMEEVYFNVLEQSEAPALAQSTDYYTLNGKKVWTLKQASRIFNRPISQIRKALYRGQFERGKVHVRYVETVEAPLKETLKELQSKVETVLKAALDVNIFMSNKALLKA